ncbi:TorD/DmsD family molecular chaperone [Deferrisoma palaeochoriense]
MRPGWGDLARWLWEGPTPEDLEALARADSVLLGELAASARKWGPVRGGEAAREALWTLLQDPFQPRVAPYASAYRDGARFGPALVSFRGFLRTQGLVPEGERFRDAEDHAAFQLDCLAFLAAEAGPRSAAYRECLGTHVLPWMPRFFRDLARQDGTLPYGGFYAGVAAAGLRLLEAEASRLGLTAGPPEPGTHPSP